MVILQQALATLVNPSDPAFGRATSLYTRNFDQPIGSPVQGELSPKGD